MRWMLAALAALALPAAAVAQFTPQRARPDADPAVWVVKDSDTTIYLFGTFHLLDGRSDWFNDEVKEAFDASDEVKLEVVQPRDEVAMAPLVAKYATDPKRRLSSRVSPETWKKLGAAFEGQDITAPMLERFDPWFVGTMLTIQAAQKIGLSGEHGAETIITAAAQAAGKPVGELEGVEMQLKMMDSMSEPMQVAFLEESLGDADRIAAVFPPMQAAWAAGDSERLAGLLNEGMAQHPELYKMILTDRNARWAEWIEQRMRQPGTLFIAVGAGHLAGKDSVQDMLAKRGLKAERYR